jgi:transcriptional regulator with XRE-family HTH domain
MKNNMKFGETLRRLRRSRLLSQQELVERCGVSRNRISDLERGISQPSPIVFINIAKALNLLPSELLTE